MSGAVRHGLTRNDSRGELLATTRPMSFLDEWCRTTWMNLQAKGLASPMSDYDLVVLINRTTDAHHLQAQLAHQLRGDDYDRRVQRYREAFGRTERTLGQIAATQGEGPD
jgi:hypothetical protein